MNEWIITKILNWDAIEENNKFLKYLNSFDGEQFSLKQIRTGISFSEIDLTKKEKARCIDIIIEEYNKCKCLQDLDNIIKKLLTKENRTNMENYIIYHLENLYNDSLTWSKNSDEITVVLSRSLILASETLPCSE